METPTQAPPVEFQQVANRAMVVVQINNATKIHDWEEARRQADDFISKKLPVPADNISLRPLILTALDTDKYVALLVKDEAAVRNADLSESTGKFYDNLAEAYSLFTYEPPDTTPKAPPQPKNPLGALIDDDLGLFGRAVGDVLPLGSPPFEFLGGTYVLRDFGRTNPMATKHTILWQRQ